MPASRVPRLLAALNLGLALAAAYWNAAVIFTPYEFAVFCDGHAYQITGGAEILAGRHPFIDFKDNYGPLTFYVSALAQWVSHGGLFGEFILVCSATAAACVVLFRLMLGLEIPLRIGGPVALVALVVQPVPYRYFLVLMPLLFLAAAWRYAARPGLVRLTLVALAATATGLYRPDFGAYVSLAGVVLVAIRARDEARRVLPAIARFLGLVLLCATPWLVWLACHGRLLAYLALSSVDGLHKASHYTVPPPDIVFAAGLFSADNLKAACLRLPHLVVLLAFVAAVREREHLTPALRAWLGCALGFAALSLLQLSHRADWMHERDVLPVCLLLVAWLATRPLPPPAPRARHFAAVVLRCSLGVLCLGLVAVSVYKQRDRDFSPLGVAENVMAYHRDLPAMRNALHAGKDPYRISDLITFLRTQSCSDDHLLAIPEAPQLNYLCSRAVAGGQLSLMPGYFDGEENERTFIANLRAHPPAFILVETSALDERFDRVLSHYAPNVYHYLESEFVSYDRYTIFTVFVPRSRAAEFIPYYRRHPLPPLPPSP
jgi:hypothetical protein